MAKSSTLPTIEFRNSWIYNIQWTRPPELQKPPAPKVWAARERKLRRLWGTHGKKILRAFSTVTGLSWHEERIIVYLTWGVRPFSDPTTINLRADVTAVFETLTHELIHRFVSDPANWRRIQKRWIGFRKLYPRDLPLAVNHVPIHAVHQLVWQKMFPKRVQALKAGLRLAPYRRAWEIVDELGAEKIVRRIFLLQENDDQTSHDRR